MTERQENKHSARLPKKEVGGKLHCRKCKEYFIIDDMYARKSLAYRGGFQRSYCKPCQSNRNRERALSRYGLTHEDYSIMLGEQGGVCRICLKKETLGHGTLSVDHDHSCCAGIESCGKCIRGLLCSRCNKVLGAVEDQVTLLQSMVDYLNW